ncbi:hypothetical protein HMPREF1405_00895 [Helicobacter pylori GAM231Ai]|nr:hypothetical protein HMPREF1405_00895 [Helicobacter pylori GAM231Ai]
MENIAIASFGYFVEHDPNLIDHDKWILAMLKLESVWYRLKRRWR